MEKLEIRSTLESNYRLKIPQIISKDTLEAINKKGFDNYTDELITDPIKFKLSKMTLDTYVERLIHEEEYCGDLDFYSPLKLLTNYAESLGITIPIKEYLNRPKVTPEENQALCEIVIDLFNTLRRNKNLNLYVAMGNIYTSLPRKLSWCVFPLDKINEFKVKDQCPFDRFTFTQHFPYLKEQKYLIFKIIGVSKGIRTIKVPSNLLAYYDALGTHF